MSAHAAAGVAPGAAPPNFHLEHDGSPDLSVAAQNINLGPDPAVMLRDCDHMLVSATPDAGWVAAAVDPATNRSPGWYLAQSTVDQWAIAGGMITTYLRSLNNLLSFSVRPSFFGQMLAALTTCGRLDLSRKYNNDEWMCALAQAGIECGTNPRVALTDVAFFEVQPRVGTSAASFIAEHSYMYQISGDLLFSDNDYDTFAAAYLMKGTAPRNTRAKRDMASDSYCRFFQSLRSIAIGRSASFKQAVDSSTVGSDEEAEYVVDTWKMLVRTGYPFSFGVRISQRNMELDRASKIAFGTSAQQEVAFREIFSERLHNFELLKKCVEAAPGSQNMHSSLEAFEQIAETLFKGASWTNFTMVKSVGKELHKISHIIHSWGPCSVVDRLGEIRDCLKQDKLMTEQKGGGADVLDSSVSIKGATGLIAMRAKEFLDTQQAIAALHAEDFMGALDATNESKSKVWRMVGYGLISRKSVNVTEIESLSKHLNRWSSYWPMVLSTDANGNINTNIQGNVFDDRDVKHLLAGRWNKIDWVMLMQSLDIWGHNLQVDASCNITDEKQAFATLCMAKKALEGTMVMLQVAKSGESGEQTLTTFVDRIINLERRSRALPEGSLQRQIARKSYAATYSEGLQECGERWAGQWREPVNFMEPMFDTFSSSKCFFNNTLDKLEKVANQLYDFKDTLCMELAKAPVYTPQVRTPPRIQQKRVTFSSDEEEPATSLVNTNRKRKAEKKAKEDMKRRKANKKIIGVHKHLTRRHKANGDTSSNSRNNCFIAVGSNMAHIPALHKVYGKKCEAVLMSVRTGTYRTMVCDCEGPGHDTEDSGFHDLPRKSGPYDKKNWAEVQRLTKAALAARKK